METTNCAACAADLTGLTAHTDHETGKKLCTVDAGLITGIRNGTIDPRNKVTVRKYPPGRMALVNTYLRGPMVTPEVDYGARWKKHVKTKEARQENRTSGTTRRNEGPSILVECPG